MFPSISRRLCLLPRNVAVRWRTRLCPQSAVAARRWFASEVTLDSGETSLMAKGGKPRHNLPFAKNLFLGRFEKQMLIFPEVLSKEEHEELEAMADQIERFFIEDVDSKSIDINAEIPEKTMNSLKELGLFGQQIPQEYGGLELNATKYARIAEATALDAGIAVTLAAHQAIGLKGILIAGTEEQKQKYLPKLATGEHVAAFCLTEPGSGSDAASISTKATISPDGNTFYLNGSKIWISNGGIADIFTVFAKVIEPGPEEGKNVERMTAFIVERKFGGVTNGLPEDKLGIRGSNTCEVFFENTPVPAENIIGEVGGGFKIAMRILNSGRFSMGSSVAGQLKRCIAYMAEHATTRKQFGQPLADFGLIKEKIAKMAIRAYAMESMAYMTAGILDSYEDPEASVEAAMVKIFSSEGSWECVSECLQIMGGLGYMKSYPYERMLRDSRILLIFEGTNEILRLFVALTGCQHAGVELRKDMKTAKNAFQDVGAFWKLVKERRAMKKGTLVLQLQNDLHPVFEAGAEALEVRVQDFQRVVEFSLRTHKDQIIHQQMVLKRLADICIDLYGMTAVMARASRSKSIGAKNVDHEVLLAKSFVAEACYRIDSNVADLDLGNIDNGDETRKKIADQIFKQGGYIASHPLSRNW